jgi:hypothetical protein
MSTSTSSKDTAVEEHYQLVDTIKRDGNYVIAYSDGSKQQHDSTR